MALYHSRLWREVLARFGETYITDRGGAETTTFVYGIEPAGRYTLSETDIYPDPLDPHSLEKCVAITMYSAVKNAADRRCAPFGLGGPAEPLVTFFPEQGPNVHLLLRKLRRVFDPRGICSPGRQVLTEEELKVYPAEAVHKLNELRRMFNMKEIER
jgi:hypothetical protein